MKGLFKNATPWRQPARANVGWSTSFASPDVSAASKHHFITVDEKAEIPSLAQQSWLFNVVIVLIICTSLFLSY